MSRGIQTAEELGAALAELTRRRAPLPEGVTVTGLINRLPPAERDKAMTVAREYDFTVTGSGKLEPFGYQWPHWNVIKPYFDYVRRLSWLLSQGRHVCDVAEAEPVCVCRAGRCGRARRRQLRAHAGARAMPQVPCRACCTHTALRVCGVRTLLFRWPC